MRVKQDKYDKKHRFCDPGACNFCVDQGNGDFYCDKHKVLVVRNWKNTPNERICKRERNLNAQK